MSHQESDDPVAEPPQGTDRRDRTLTEKGREYRMNILRQQCRSALSMWHNLAISTELLLSESEDINEIKAQRNSLIASMEALKSTFNKLDSLTDSGEPPPEFTDLLKKEEEFETEHLSLLRRITDSIRSIQIETGSVGSRASNLSRFSAKQDTAADVASLQTKLKYLDKEAEIRLALEKLDIQRQIKVAEARARAIDDLERDQMVTTGIKREPVDKEQRVAEFVANTTSNGDQQTVGEQNKENITSNLVHVLSETFSLSRLPPPEPVIFKGDPLTFVEWKRSFELLIEKRCLSGADRLFYLQKYVGGEARSVVEGLSYRTDEDAYKQALQKLETRYGHPFIIQRAYRKKLDNWPKVAPKDAIKLREFSDFLQACSEAIPHVPALSVLSDFEQNQKLLTKLPDWLTMRWNRLVTNELDADRDYPSFSEFAKFVAKEAKIACNPVSSLYALNHNDKPKESRRPNASTFSTTARSTDSSPASWTHPCAYCKGKGHGIAKCVKFMEISLRQRRDYIRTEGRCFACLNKGHHSKECKWKHTCQVCKRKHPTCMHDFNFNKPDESSQGTSDESPETPDKRNAKENKAVTLNVTTEEGDHTSAVVPVWLSSDSNPRQEILVYALLDTQSNTTFVDEGVAQSLQIEGEPIKLKLTTMVSESTVVMANRVSGLRVRGYNTPEYIDLPPSYTRQCIPFDRSQIPTSNTARNWSHLKELADEIPPLQQCDIGLLIGFNCSQALAPRQIITGKDHEPYGMKTDLGWCIVGSSSPLAYLDTAYCHRISAKESPVVTPRDIVHILESDFIEAKGDRPVSHNDLKFIDIMDNGIHRREDGHLEMPLPFKSDHPTLPDNKRMALIRLSHLKRKFVRDRDYFNDYKCFMENIISRGYAELVSETEDDGARWYIPQHGV